MDSRKNNPAARGRRIAVEAIAVCGMITGIVWAVAWALVKLAEFSHDD